MPKARLSHCSALAFSIFFPWFPIVPAQVPEAEQAAVAAPAPKEPLVLPGVVIEEIPKGSALEKAGLQVGDVILSWERLPNPPANPERARGELSSYFDWLELEVEQVPRGAVVLRGRRDGEPLELRVEPGLWEVKVRPVLSPTLEEIYLAGKALLVPGNVEAAVGEWRPIAEGAVVEGGGSLRVGLDCPEDWGRLGRAC